MVAIVLATIGVLMVVALTGAEAGFWSLPVGGSVSLGATIATMALATAVAFPPVGHGAGAPARVFVFGWIAAGFVIFVAQPEPDDLGQFFSTAAQVLAGLLVAVVIEGRGLDRDTIGRKFQRQGVAVVALGALVALVALIPALADTFYRVAFAVVLASGLASFATLLLVGREIGRAATRGDGRDSDTDE